MASINLAICGVFSPLMQASSLNRTDFSTPSSPRPALRVAARPLSFAGGDASTEVDERDGDEADASSQDASDDAFEERLAKLRRRGTGTKAEKRKARKAGDYVSASSRGKGPVSVLLPPVPLQDPISDGLRVELGFNSYTERINGRFAELGLAAFLLVELATGSSFLKYHDSSVIGLQAYFMLAVSAIFIKYEKEKSSIWPGSKR